MNIRQSVLGEVAVHSETGVSGIDLGSLLRRLLLFDTVVVQSDGLREVAFLVRAFGKTGLIELLNSGILKLVCECRGIITDVQKNGIRELANSYFSFGMFEIGERDKVLQSGLVALQGIPGLKNAERAALEETVLTKLVRPKPEYTQQLLDQLESDLRNNTPALKAAIAEQLTAQLGVFRPFVATVEEPVSRTFHIVSDLPNQFGLSDEKTHAILGAAVGAVARLDQRIADMEAYSAITGFTESEAPLLFGKLAGVISPQNPDRMEKQFMRVVAIAGLPDYVQNRRIDVEQLLKARESVECREFRAWLSGSLESTDEQIAEMVTGVRNKVGTMLHSTVGKAMKFAAITAVGLISGGGLVAGPVAGALDTFVVDKLFPNSGVLAFLAATYPSLFLPL